MFELFYRGSDSSINTFKHSHILKILFLKSGYVRKKMYFCTFKKE